MKTSSFLKVFTCMVISVLSVSCVKDKNPGIDNPEFLTGNVYSMPDKSNNNENPGPASTYLEFTTDTEFLITDPAKGQYKGVTLMRGKYTYDGHTVILYIDLIDAATGEPFVDTTEGTVKGNTITFEKLFIFGQMTLKKTTETSWKAGANTANTSGIKTNDWSSTEDNVGL